MYKMSTFPDWRYENPMSITDPKRKVELSKHFASGYTLTNALKAEESIDGLVVHLLDRMDQFAASGLPMNLDDHVTYLALDLLGEVLFSKPFGYSEAGSDIKGSIATNAKLIGAHAVLCHFRSLQLIALNPVTTKLMPWGHLFNTAFAALNERRANPDARFDVVAHWIRTATEHPDRLTDRDLLANVTANVGAGSDTLSCAMQSFLYYMARNPEAWARVRSEISEAQKSEGSCRTKVIQHADSVKLPFFQACVKEALRIHNPVPMGLPRVVPQGGLTIGDTTLPAGTTVSINPWVIHHSKELWGPDALSFNPDRWLGPDAAQLDKYWCPVSSHSIFAFTSAPMLCSAYLQNTVWCWVHVLPWPTLCQDGAVQDPKHHCERLRHSTCESSKVMEVESQLHHGASRLASSCHKEFLIGW